MLGRLLSKATNDVSSQDLHDRALLYYRMLRSGTDFMALESAVKSSTVIPEAAVGGFSEEADDAFRAELMTEFNTLSILYGKPSANFIAPEHQVKYVKMPEDHPLVPSDGGGGGSVSSYPTTTLHATMPHDAPAQVHIAPAPASTDYVDLLGDLGSPSPPPAAPPAPSTTATFSLNAALSMTAEEYQSKWGTIPDADATVSMVPLKQLPTSADQVEQSLARVAVLTMASGELPNEFKFFLYATDSASGTVFLIQSNIEKTEEPIMIVTVKMSGGGGGGTLLVEKLISTMTSALG
jgi:AP-4 complex subunit beta-1